MRTEADDNDLPRRISKHLPRPIHPAVRTPPVVRTATAAENRKRLPRAYAACGKPLERTEAFCSLICFRAGPSDENGDVDAIARDGTSEPKR
jgi:hypothetical protein